MTSNQKRQKVVIITIALFSLVVVCYYLHVLTGLQTSYHIDLWPKPKYQWRPEFIRLNGPLVSPGDRLLLEKLSKYYLEKGEGEFVLTNSTADYDPSMGQSQVIRKLFAQTAGQKNNRFFVECGALDGETRSNTLFLERSLGWNGLLIEADPSNYLELVTKKRRAWRSNSCLSTKPYPVMVSFEQRVNQGKISQSYTAGYMEKGYVDAQCFPFASYMASLNISVVDYFSLDVEGLELEILKTIDFNAITINSLSVEFIHDIEGKEAIEEFMKTKGYSVLGLVTHPNWLANDFIFVRTGFLQKEVGLVDLDSFKKNLNINMP